MTNTARALYYFASGFDWNAYPETSVPRNAQLPYITYTLQEYDWKDTGMLQMRLWYRGEDYAALNLKIDQISLATENGKQVKVNGSDGKLVIYRGRPFCQYQPVDEENIKVAYLNFDVHYLFD